MGLLGGHELFKQCLTGPSKSFCKPLLDTNGKANESWQNNDSNFLSRLFARNEL
jgi:hypothetical protein